MSFGPIKLSRSEPAIRRGTWLWSGHESSLLSHSMARTNLLFIVLSKARVKIAGTRRPHTQVGARGVHLRLHLQDRT